MIVHIQLILVAPHILQGAPRRADANVTTNLVPTKYYLTLVDGALRATVDRHLKPLSL